MTSSMYGYTCKFCGKHINWADRHDCRAHEEIASLRARLAEAERDLARYREALEKADAEQYINCEGCHEAHEIIARALAGTKEGT